MRLVLVAWLLGLALPSAALACGEPTGPVVEHGRSPRGAAWRIQASFSAGRAEFDFGPTDPRYSGQGFGESLSTHTRVPLLDAVPGQDLGAHHESDLAGFTSARVVWMALHLRRGPVLGIAPRIAPPRLRWRYPYLRRVRFFDRFVPPRFDLGRLDLYDAEGRRLGTAPVHNEYGLPAARTACGP